MSMTSGPVLPESTGNSSDFPSGSFRLAVLSVMVFLSGGASGGTQMRHDVLQVRLIAVAAARDDVPQVVVGQVEQLRQVRVELSGAQVALQHDIELQQAAPAFPLEPFSLDAFHSDGALNQQLLDVIDRLGRIEPLRAHVDAVHDGVAAEQAIRVVQV